ncbi:protein-export chaperone SecB [Notoacmeibacter ruber]|uniref:Protein-export protein SecB n=1 Tax=Notoacmeibacter ruber TaxID=2670375 RepID=A0A3L7JFT3_9HYPH|nr:protein-export chaperone SecB [Notoacmeibacter ruber]RLQ89627.1 protein-export chaperone SecB [Notoacmeibacter ruber]
MAENETPKPEATEGQKPQPQINALVQYMKDLSFEAPATPNILRELKSNPAINVNVAVNANALGNDTFDIVLKLEAKASMEEKVVFHIELEYGGIFKVSGFPTEHVTPVVYIECPRLLFPFARQVIANTVQASGFPPLMLEPIDFAQLFARSAAEAKAREAVSQNTQSVN